MKRFFLFAAVLLSVNSLCVRTSVLIAASVVGGEGRSLGIGKGSPNTDYSDRGGNPPVAAVPSNLASHDCFTESGACEMTEQIATQAIVPEKASAPNDVRVGPRYDVTQFGAVGDGRTDDTAALQAAFNACWNNGVYPYGGTVEFTGTRTFVVSRTINAYDTCRIEGVGAAAPISGPQSPIRIDWNGPVAGTVYKLSGFTVAANTSSIALASNPVNNDTVTINGTVVTFVTSGATGNEVNIGANATQTSTALYTMLKGSTDRNLRRSQPYTNTRAGAVDFAYQGDGYWETVSTSDPKAINVALALSVPSSPSGGRAPALPDIFTFPVANSLKIGDWVILQGFTANGIVINRVVAQVAQATGSSFTVGVPFTPFVPLAGRKPLLGTFADTGTATTINVVLAFDSYARMQQEISNIFIAQQRGLPLDRHAGVNIYFGSRADSGTRVLNTWSDGALYFDYYFSAGGVNVEFDKGWRADGGGMADIYWRVAGYDNFLIANGTANVGEDNGGAVLMLDTSSCDLGNVEGTLSHIDMESDNFNLAPGLGIITLYDCGGSNFTSQFFLNLDGVTESETNAVFNPGVLMSPPNDLALQLTVVNSSINGQTAANRWVGIPALARSDMGGVNGWISLLNYTPSLNSIGTTNYGAVGNTFAAPTQLVGDVNIGQLWQYKTKASAILYSDTAFAALPNATTLFAGQILAPPAYWNGANGKRYAIDVVYQTGTTGTPNHGKTQCSGTKSARILTCDNATDLSTGQRITIGVDIDKIVTFIDAANSSAVRVHLAASLSTSYSNQTLQFSAPLLASEIQMPTKSSGAPSAESWSQGDIEQNSKASANGIAAWVNVAAGKPGTWAAIPLGNSSGQINSSQLSGTTGSGNVVLAKSPTVSGLIDTGTTRLNDVTISGICSGCGARSMRTAQAFYAGTAPSSSTLTMFAAGMASPSCTSEPGTGSVAQLLMTTSGELSDLAVRCADTGINPLSGVFGVWDLPSGTALSGPDSGVDTGLTVTYGKAKANTSLFDSTHTFAYTKGDLLRIQFKTQASETLGNCEVSFDY